MVPLEKFLDRRIGDMTKPDLARGGSRAFENFTRGLLTTTCLTAAGSAAIAGPITLPNSDFPNTAPGVLLPAGTTVVNAFAGGLPAEAGNLSPEWFEFQGLTPGSGFTLTAVYNPLGRRSGSGNGESGMRMNIFDSIGEGIVTNVSLELNQNNTAIGNVPGDGLLDVEMTAGSPGSNYQVTLGGGGVGVPEPGTLGVVGLGLAGALAWSRKRRK
jgi:hypothetical protein